MKTFKTYLWFVLLLAIVCSALLAHIGIPMLAIFGGMAVSLAANRFISKKWWTNELTETQKWTFAAVAALIGSQMGWVALLI